MQAGAVLVQPVKRPGAGEVFNGALVDEFGGDARGEIRHRPEGPALGALLLQVPHGRLAHIAHGGQRIGDAAVDHGEIGAGDIHIRRQHLDLQPLRLAAEGIEFVRIAHIEVHGGGEELDRVVGLEPGGLVGDQRVSRRVALVEAVACELRHLLEDAGGLLAVHIVGFGALDETDLLLVHFLLDLLAHGAAQQVSIAERIAGQHLGDLHHLLLVDHDAEGLGQDRLQARMQIIGLLVALLTGEIFGDVVHRARAVQGHKGDDVLEAVRLHLAQDVAHAGTFQLEHAHRITARQHVVGEFVIERQGADIHLDAAIAQQFHRALDHRQGLEAEEVELHEPRGLHPFHVELGDRHVRARVAVKRHQLVQGPVADHHTGGMGRGVAVEPLKLQRHADQPVHHLFGAAGFLQLGFALDSLAEGDRVGRVVGHQLAQPVHLAIGHLQHAAHIAQHGAGLQLTEGDDLGDAVAAIFLLHIGDHLVAPVLAEVHVEVRHGHAFGVKKPLEQQAEAQRIEVGDGQRPGDHRARARTTPRPHGDVVVLRPFDEVGHDEEVTGEAHIVDDAELVFEPLPVVLLRGKRAEGLKPHAQPVLSLALQFLRFAVHTIQPFEARQDGRDGARAVGAAAGDLHRRGNGLGQIGEQGRHFAGGLETVLRRQAAAVLLHDIGAVGHAEQRVMGFVVILVEEEHLIGGDDRQVVVEGRVEQHRLGDPFLAGAVALQFDIEPSGEGLGQLQRQRAGRVLLAGDRQPVDRAIGSAGEGDQPVGVAGQRLERHMRLFGAVGAQIGVRCQRHQVEVAGLVLGKQRDGGVRRADAAAIGLHLKVQRQGAADYRLDARA